MAKLPDLPGSAPILETKPFDKNEFQSEMAFSGFRPGSITGQQEKFVHLVVSGMSNAAAAAAVGGTAQNALWWGKMPAVAAAMEYFRAKNRAKLNFTIETAHTMLMEAWGNCKDATEQVSVVKELVKLHGVAAPPRAQQVDININNQKQVERAPDHKLLELAGVDVNYLVPVPKVRAQAPVIEAEFTETPPEKAAE
jgi:hypothetical protein